MVREGDEKYPSIDAALEDAEQGIRSWLGE
jgi:hypothetical protein